MLNDFTIMKAIVICIGLLFGITVSAAVPKNALPEVTSANKATYEKWSQQITGQIANIRKLLTRPNLSPKLRPFYQGEIKRLEQEHAQIVTCLLQHRIKQQEKQLADLKRSIQNKPKPGPNSNTRPRPPRRFPIVIPPPILPPTPRGGPSRPGLYGRHWIDTSS